MDQHKIAKNLGIQVTQKKHADVGSVLDMEKTGRPLKFDKSDQGKLKKLSVSNPKLFVK